MSQLQIEAGPDTRRIDHDCADCGATPIVRCQYRIGDSYYCWNCADKRLGLRPTYHMIRKLKGKTLCGKGIIGDHVDGKAAAVDVTTVPTMVTCSACHKVMQKAMRRAAEPGPVPPELVDEMRDLLARRVYGPQECRDRGADGDKAAPRPRAEIDPSEYLAAVEGERHDGLTDEESERHDAAGLPS